MGSRRGKREREREGGRGVRLVRPKLSCCASVPMKNKNNNNDKKKKKKRQRHELEM